MRYKILPFVLFAVILTSEAEARTWYITVAGDGDAPTINAAMDSCSGGDTILVQSGTHVLEAPVFPPYTTERLFIMGETDDPPAIIDCSNSTVGFVYSGGIHDLKQLIIQNAGGAAININLYSVGWIRISDNIIRNNDQYGILITQSSCDIHIFNNLIYSNNSGIASLESMGMWVWANTFADHTGTTGTALYIDSYTYTNTIEANIFYDNTNLLEGMPSNLIFKCNDLYNNDNGEDQFLGIDKNIGVDPQFCSETPYIDGNFYLQSDSPLLYTNHHDEECRDIGARLSNCGTVATETSSWGRIKAIHK